MGKKRKQGDPRNFFIFVLLLIIGVESYLLLDSRGVLKRDAKIASGDHSSDFAPFTKPGKLLKDRKEALNAKGISTKSSPIVEPKIKSPIVSRVTKSVRDAVPVKPNGSVPHYEPVKFQPNEARIAIILDDWGYRLESCEDLRAMESPVAVAILPGLPHSKEVAQCAHDAQKIVMLHLPLEPHQYAERYPSDYIITTTMNQNRVEKILTKNLNEIPFLAGVNNHMGSKATEDRHLMSVILNRLKKRKLFFIDSLVTSKSVCRGIARQVNVPFAKRDVFLDNQNDREYIEGQFDQLAELASRKGFAVAIGHDRPLTLRIVREQMDRLKKEGFKIVSIEEFLQ